MSKNTRDLYRTRVPKGMTPLEYEHLMSTKDVPHTYEQPMRRTVYSKDPRVCKHQFAGNRPFCPYCATTNPNLRMSFNEIGE
jgi:hypothetical protein